MAFCRICLVQRTRTAAAAAIILFIFLASCTSPVAHEESVAGQIVFASKRGGSGYQLYTIRTDGTGLRQLTSHEEGAWQPVWSPDGERIVFNTSTRATTLGPSIYIVDADGKNMRPLKKLERETGLWVLWGNNPAWSPDGNRIAHEICTNCELGGRNSEIVTIEVKGEIFDASQTARLTDHPARDDEPAWSPDGRQIVFRSNRDYAQADTARFRDDLYVVDADGNNLRRLTTDGYVHAPTWSSDGKYVAFGRKGKILRLEMASGDIVEMPAPEMDGYILEPITWSVEHERMLVMSRPARLGVDFRRSLHILNTQTGGWRTVVRDRHLDTGHMPLSAFEER